MAVVKLGRIRFIAGCRKLFAGLVDLVYPKVCLVCRKKLASVSVDELVCLSCWDKIKKNLPPFCRGCGRQLEKKTWTKHRCVKCIKQPLSFDRAFSPCVYDGAIKELIHQFKYQNKDYLGPTMARFMVDFIREYDIPMDVLDLIIPMPLHSARRREREFNQAEILSNQIARIFSKPVLNHVLMRNRATKTQTELKPQERFLNVQGSFVVKDPQSVNGKNILLVDDVLTTGATSSEAARALKAQGAKVVFVLTLAS